jgi:hypothetical protein
LYHWADGGGAFPKTEASEAKKDVGYDTNEIPPSQEWNWWRNFEGQLMAWLDGAHVRAFDDIAEAITATSAADVFRVVNPTAGNRWFGLSAFSVTPTGFTAVTDGATDGEQAYFIDTASIIVALNPATGAEIWNKSPANTASGAIAADGRRVYVCGNGSAPGIKNVNRVTGLVDGSTVGGTPTSAGAIAANGTYAVIGSSGGALNNIYYYDITAATPVETGTSAHGNPVGAVAVDASYVYWGGARGGGFDLESNVLSTRTSNWQVTFATTGSTIISDIVTDGDLVFCGGTRVALTAGGNANLFIRDALTGAEVLNADVQIGGTDPLTDLAWDGKTLWCKIGGATNRTVAVRFSPAPYVVWQSTTGWVVYDADGVGFISDDGAGKAQRFFNMTAPVTLQRTLGTDNNRQPFHKLAIPVR